MLKKQFQYRQACGEWVRMPCTPGTVFEVRAQICIPQQINELGSTACSAGSSPVCSCAQNSDVNICPGESRCAKVKIIYFEKYKNFVYF